MTQLPPAFAFRVDEHAEEQRRELESLKAELMELRDELPKQKPSTSK